MSETLQILRIAGLISRDGSAVRRSDRSRQQSVTPQPFKLAQRLKPGTVAEIVARYEAGEPLTALAGRFGISKTSVIKLLREVDVPIRKQRVIDDQIAEAAQLYESGLSLAKIGAR
ncbi:MAG: hypothetical protein QOF15_2170, partial [Mycobacterium sp.]|nr:hypothetical protein [Mycobacterium sp.]